MKAAARALGAVIALMVAAQAPAQTAPQPLRPDQAAFRALYKELVETDTTHAHGNCTLAAERMATRLKAAGFADADLNIFVPPGFPTYGGLIATLRGTDASAGAVLLLAHLDVVEAKREDWVRDPFKLIEENGVFYGRGTFDDKAQAAIFTDAMARLKPGPAPRRTLKLVLTCGEESGAAINNIRWLIENHRDWLNAAFALNEGGNGTLDAAGKPQTLGFQAGEKVSQNFRLEATNPGGHSSMPRPDNAIYDLSRALIGVAGYSFPVQFNATTRGYFSAMAGIVGGDTGAAMRALLANPRDAAADAIVSKDPAWHSMLRTTCVATLVEAGHAINALPQRARANVNCRMFPGDSPEGVAAQLRTAVGDSGVTVTAVPPVNPQTPAPPLTPLVFGTAKAVAAQHFPGVPVLPLMLTGATDGRFLTAAGVPTYGVPGGFLTPTTGMHGLNENVSAALLYAQRDYLFDLIKAYAATGDTQ